MSINIYWIKKMWYIYTIDDYRAIKKNGIMPFAATLRDRKIIKLSEVSQTKKNKYHMILLTCEILKNDTSNLFTKQKLTDLRNKHGYQGKRLEGRNSLGVWD